MTDQPDTDPLTSEWERHFHRLSADLHAKSRTAELADTVAQELLTDAALMIQADKKAAEQGGKSVIKPRDKTRMLEVAHRIAKDSRVEINRRLAPAKPQETLGQPIHQNPSLASTLANLNLPPVTKAGMAQAQLEAMPLDQAVLFYDSLIQEPRLGEEFVTLIQWYPPLELAEGDIQDVD